MSSIICNVLSFTLLLGLITPSLALSPQHNSNCKEPKVDIEAFEKLLNQVDPPALHAALHDFSPRKFEHGMFPEDRTAVEAIHREQPGVATGILKIARLAKRQDNATVTTTTPPEQQSSSEPATTLVTPVPEGDESSTQTAESPTITTSITNTADAAATTSAPVTTSATAASPSSSRSLAAGEVVTTTNSVGLTIVSTVGGGATTLSPSDSPSSNAPRSSITSTLVRTSIFPNGQQSTITAVTVVAGGGPPDTPTGTAGVGTSGTRSEQPSLQTGEAVMTRGFGKEMAVVVGAAVGVAILL
ncbi:MAG: hypothetical protein Q9217_000079 [Psora testacea]